MALAVTAPAPGVADSESGSAAIRPGSATKRKSRPVTRPRLMAFRSSSAVEGNDDGWITAKQGAGRRRLRRICDRWREPILGHKIAG